MTSTGRTRRRLAADQLADLVQIDARLTTLKAELKQAVQARGSQLMTIYGIGPGRGGPDPGRRRRHRPVPRSQPLRLLDRHRPIDASSGEQIRHRLSRAGNRRLNHVLYMAAFVQLRHDTNGRTYYRRKLAAGKTPMEAMRCLKRRLSDVVYRQLVADAAARRQRRAPAAQLPPHTAFATRARAWVREVVTVAGHTVASAAVGTSRRVLTTPHGIAGSHHFLERSSLLNALSHKRRLQMKAPQACHPSRPARSRVVRPVAPSTRPAA